MEFSFNINNLFNDEISFVDSRLLPTRASPANARQYKTELSQVVDEMGKASAKAQGLHGPITSSQKLAFSSHHLYVKIDADANSGRGAVIGFLKVGTKKLFIFDRHGDQHELEPLCVLDFYVHESCQRQGSGKMLFEAMLQTEGVSPQHLAIDRPSPKFLSFLQKHYGLKAPIPQVNNFVIFDSFFRDKTAMSSRRQSIDKSLRNPYKQQQRGSAHNRDRPPSGISVRNRPSDANGNKYPLTDMPVNVDTSGGVNRPSSRKALQPLMPLSRPQSGVNPLQPFSRPQSGVFPLQPSSRPQSGTSSLHNRPPSGASGRQDALSMAAYQSNYSRYQRDTNTDCAIEVDRTPPRSNNSAPREPSPPLLRREGPPQQYKQLFKNSDYLDRRGRLKTSGSSPCLTNGSNADQQRESKLPSLTSHGDLYSAQRNYQKDTAWSIFGVPRAPTNYVDSRQLTYYQKNQKTTLW